MEFNDRRTAYTCETCGSAKRDDGRSVTPEYGGARGLGCPGCGGEVSPKVTVKNGMVHHDGQPVTSFNARNKPEHGSFVKPHPEGGYVAGHYSIADETGTKLVTGRGKTPKAAAEAAAAADAERLGRAYVKRSPEAMKRIERARKEWE